MEFGPRALGARSIIASPPDHAINDSLNERLDRSEFMPFAPVVLEEDAEPRVRHHRRQPLCRAFHDDHLRGPAGVARAHSGRGACRRHRAAADRARRRQSALFRHPAAFRASTGLPVLVNTSFNVHEEPIVNRPEECRRRWPTGASISS